MTSKIPNLKGLVTKDMVRTIGSGTYAASYVPWSKIAELLNEHAPGWYPELVPATDGTVLHRAPKGGYLLIRFRNVETGVTTPEFIQAVQDNRHKSVPYDQIDSRDISDCSRRGFAMAAGAVFNLGIELWTREELEDGYSRNVEAANDQPVVAPPKVTVTKEAFLDAAIDKGLTPEAAEELAGKLKGDYKGGITRLGEKNDAWVKSFNGACAPKKNAA